ncbi:MAG: chloride channel protein [Pseudomonadota bacterium]
MFGHLKTTGRELLSADAWKTRLVFWAGAVTVGLVAVAFAAAAEFANDGFHALIDAWAFAPLVVCPLGLAVVAYLTRTLFPGSQGSGIPQSIAALAMTEHATRSRVLSLRIACGKIMLTVIGLFSGAAIGREGPTVHIGASIMFSLGRFANFPMHYMDRGLILAGSAAGIAAAFNTPLAGILFAIEEMSKSFEARTSGTLLTAVFLAGIVAVIIQGNYAYFGFSSATLTPLETIRPVLICGIVGGLLGGLFSHTLIWSTRRIAPLAQRHPYLLAATCGVFIAVTGMLSGNLTFGTGYQEARMVITGAGELPSGYPLLKMLATLGSYLSGIPGGIFSPSLATGAGLGSALAPLMPGTDVGAIIILGMVGYFTGVVQTPITALVIVMEMTRDTGLVLPLMATAFMAYITSRVICPDSLYPELAQSFLGNDPGRKPAAPAASDGGAPDR